jgi:flavin-dependent dehydrogenase
VRQFPDTDVLIVGGGPAGLAAAIAARGKGLRATVADCRLPPIDKTCGEGLMPEAVRALEALGVAIDPGRAAPFRGIRFLDADSTVDASFPSGQGLGVRRTALHEALVRRAEEAGVSIEWGVRVEGLCDGGIVIAGRERRCRWVIGADGRDSRVRRWAGLDAHRHDRRRFAFRRHYTIPCWSDCVEVYWADGCQIYITPVNRAEVSVCVLSRSPHLRLEAAVARVPDLARRLEGAAPASTERGAITATLRLQRVSRGAIALLGDASGSVDAVTGDGISLAFRQALALAEALACGDLAAYERVHKRIARRPALMASLMLTLDRSHWLRRRVLRGLASRPAAFSKLLAFHVGALDLTPLATHSPAASRICRD